MLRGGSGTMDDPYWCRERSVEGLLIYESFFGQTIEDFSFEIADLRIVDVRKRQKWMKINRDRGPGNGNAVLEWSGGYKEEWVLQVYDDSGYGIKIADGSIFITSEVKDFANLFIPDGAHTGKWINRKVQYNYTASQDTASQDLAVNGTGTEIHDSDYTGVPNYQLVLAPARKTNFSFSMDPVGGWSFYYKMNTDDLTDPGSEGTVTSVGPDLPPLQSSPPGSGHLDWVLGVRGTQTKNAILGLIWQYTGDLYNPDPFVAWTTVKLQEDYDDKFAGEPTSPLTIPFPAL
jgi:hypothetical protein